MMHLPESDKPDNLLTEVRCPNCNSTSVSLQVFKAEKVPSKLKSSSRLILGIVLLSVAACSISMGISMSTIDPAAFWIYATPGLLCLVPGIISVVRYVQSGKARQFACTECGHRWKPACPSCGKTENVWQPVRINRTSGKQVGWFFNLIGGGLFAAVGIVLMVFFAVNFVIAAQLGRSSPWYYIALGAMFVSMGMPLFLGYFRASKASQFECAECGHKWIWVGGLVAKE